MGQPGRPKARLVLSPEQRRKLEALVQEPPENAPALSLRCRIVLLCAQGATNRAVARELGVSEATVARWRERYRTSGLAALYDDRRPGVASTITDDQVQAVFVATLEESPPQGPRWTTRSMAEHTDLSQSSVVRIWRTYQLGPGRLDIFTLSGDLGFARKVREISGLSLNPPEAGLALAVDENAAAPAPGGASIGSLRPWIPEPLSEDERKVTTDLHRALEAAAGRVIADRAVARQIERARDAHLRWFLDLMDQSVPEDLDVHVVVDHSATKMTVWLHEWLLDHLRFELHFVPNYRWWMTVVERWFAWVISAGLESSTSKLVTEINEWIETADEEPGGVVWNLPPRGNSSGS